MLKFWKFLLHNRQFSYLVILALLGAGIFDLVAIPKENAPEVRVPIGIVTTALPGASAADVERLVTNKMEDGLNNIKNLDKLTSTSHQGLSVVVVQFLASADVDKSIADLKSEIDKIKPDLPSEAKDPSVTEVNISDSPVLIISVSGDYAPEDLTTLGNDLKDELK